MHPFVTFLKKSVKRLEAILSTAKSSNVRDIADSDGIIDCAEPGLFLRAMEKYDIDMAASVNVGDGDRDMEAGRRAGVGRNFQFCGDFGPVISELQSVDIRA